MPSTTSTSGPIVLRLATEHVLGSMVSARTQPRATGASRCAALVNLMSHRRIVLLQGPAGPFFRQLATALTKDPTRVVHKVHLNGGDELFFRGVREPRIKNVCFDGPRGQWHEWIMRLMQFRRADAIVLFGQCRFYHSTAIDAARRLGVAVYVFEEGYIRPNFVTLEQGGVNGASSLPRDPLDYTTHQIEPGPQPAAPRHVFARMAACHAMYYLAARSSRRRYPHYQHHRPLNVLTETARWCRGGVRKLVFRATESRVLAKLLCPQASKRYFVVPLQVHNDSQISHHSRYGCVEQFIEEVVKSFAEHATADKWLVFKHHPMDRAYTNYRRMLAAVARLHGVSDRVFYIHDAPLPALLRNAAGAITINSTVGFSALLHGTPCFAAGDCIYAMSGLAQSGMLDTFWQWPGTVDRDLVQAFRAAVIQRTQLTGSFYHGVDVLDQADVAGTNHVSKLVLDESAA